MKLFLLILREQDDPDHIFGVFDTRAKAQAHKEAGVLFLVGCAEIVELELNAVSVERGVVQPPVVLTDENDPDGSQRRLRAQWNQYLKQYAESSPWVDLVRGVQANGT